MLFSGDDLQKNAQVLSGGEKMRCMIARMMLEHPNLVILDHPTNHLDMESIQAFNNNMKTFPGKSDGIARPRVHRKCLQPRDRTDSERVIDKYMDFEEYMTDEKIKALRESKYIS
jgi:ABC-type transport system involved in cytochrome c biogenesis ATPase subunit